MKINWRKVLRILTLGLVVAADRSAKVRRVKGKIDDWLGLILAIDEMAQEEGLSELPYKRIVAEYGLSEAEGRELVSRFKLFAKAVKITDVPQDQQY